MIPNVLGYCPRFVRYVRLSRVVFWGWTLALSLGICLASTTGFAQGESDRATARALAKEGFKALMAKDYKIAEDRFRRADALVHAPTIVVDRGRALMGLKRYVEAQEQFELVLREGVPDKAPKVWKQALVDAEELLEEVKPKVAWLTISIPDISDATIDIDGQPIPNAAKGVRRATNPGTRIVNMSAEGYAPRQVTIDLVEGEERTLEVVLDPLPVPVPIEEKPELVLIEEPVAETSPQVEEPGGLTGTLAYMAFGIGGAGIIAGSVFGILTLNKHADLTDAGCSVGSVGKCPPNLRPEIDEYYTMSWISGISFAAGLVGAATGVVLLLTDGGETSETDPSEIQLNASLGEVVMRGVF